MVGCAHFPTKCSFLIVVGGVFLMPTLSALWQGNRFWTIRESASGDQKGRINLGKGVVSNKRYRAYENDVGQILLDPIVEISVHELEFMADPEKLEQWNRANAEAAAGQLQEKGSFLNYVVEQELAGTGAVSDLHSHA